MLQSFSDQKMKIYINRRWKFADLIYLNLAEKCLSLISILFVTIDKRTLNMTNLVLNRQTSNICWHQLVVDYFAITGNINLNREIGLFISYTTNIIQTSASNTRILTNIFRDFIYQVIKHWYMEFEYMKFP